jgi:hypothetical protein
MVLCRILLIEEDALLFYKQKKEMERTITPLSLLLYFSESEGYLVGFITYLSLHCLSCFLTIYGALRVSCSVCTQYYISMPGTHWFEC